MTERLFSTLELSKLLGMTKQGVNKAEREGRIEAPAYTIGPFKGWTEAQAQRILISHMNGLTSKKGSAK